MTSSNRIGMVTAALLWASAWGLLGPSIGAAQGAAPAGQGGDAQALAKQLSNPVSDLVSIPFQFNWESGVGPDEGLRTILNIQPVLPMTLNDKWNLIERWIMPYVSQPEFLGSRSGRPAFLWEVFTNSAARRELLRSGWKDMGKAFVMAAALDAVYQVIVHRRISVIGMLFTATLLALVPYTVLRGPANRIARLFIRSRAANRSG